MFRVFVEAYLREGRLDDALRTIIVQRKMKLVIDPTWLTNLISALYKAEKYADILSIGEMIKEDGASFLPADLPYIIGVRIKSGDEAGALEIIKNTDKGELSGALKTLMLNAETEEARGWLENIDEKLNRITQ